jgi:glycosidase
VASTLGALPETACPVWAGSNHDVGRFPSRWCGGDERKVRLALLILATLPGTTVLYYGDEIGMTDVDVPPQLRRDKMTLDDAAPQGNRDRARTPCAGTPRHQAKFTSAGVHRGAGQQGHRERDRPAHRTRCSGSAAVSLRRAGSAVRSPGTSGGQPGGQVGLPGRRPDGHGEFHYCGRSRRAGSRVLLSA